MVLTKKRTKTFERALTDSVDFKNQVQIETLQDDFIHQSRDLVDIFKTISRQHLAILENYTNLNATLSRIETKLGNIERQTHTELMIK